MRRLWLLRGSSLLPLCVLVMSLGLVGMPSGFLTADSPGEQDLPGTIDGAVSPSSIPDRVAYEVFFRALGKSSSLQFAEKVGLDVRGRLTLFDMAESFDKLVDKYDSAIKSAEQAKIATMQEQKEQFLTKQLGSLPNQLGSTAAAALEDYIRTRIKSQIKKIPLAAVFEEAGSVYIYSDSWSAEGFIYGVSVLVPEKAADVKDVVFKASTTIIAPDGVRSSSGQTEGSPSVINIHRLPIGKDDGEYTIRSSFDAKKDSRKYRIGTSIHTCELAPSVYVDNLRVNPTQISSSGGQAQISVSIVTTSDVPQGAIAKIEVDQVSVVNEITYAVNPDRVQIVTLQGGGLRTDVSWTIVTTIGQKKAGEIISVVQLTEAYTCSPGPGCDPQPIRIAVERTSNFTITVVPPRTDQDGDGWAVEDGDCEDTNPLANPGLSESWEAGNCCDGSNNNCADGWDEYSSDCPCSIPFIEGSCCICPIVINTAGNDFDLTGLQRGIYFDLNADGKLDRVGWIQGDDAFLVLDRNWNGTIDDGSELFGNATRLGSGRRAPNRYEVLKEFDANGDGFIDGSDPIYPQLRLWRDLNGDGMSQPGELSSLASLHVARLSLDYKESGRRDRHGNRFRYRAKVYASDNSPAHNRFAYDVFPVFVPGR